MNTNIKNEKNKCSAFSLKSQTHSFSGGSTSSHERVSLEAARCYCFLRNVTDLVQENTLFSGAAVKILSDPKFLWVPVFGFCPWDR